jgi:poly(3-hydroxybutyrate) depolymerase
MRLSVLVAVILSALPAGAAPRAVKPSAGCGKQAAAGALTIVSQGGKQAYVVTLPPGYDPGKPQPLGFAFHGFERTHTDCRDDDCPGFADVVGKHAVAVYMKSISKGWDTALERNTAYFGDVLARVKRDYCVDENRVFVAGTSSGAGFANHLGCRFGDQLLAIAPVHGGMPAPVDCKGHPAVVNIHGIADKLIPRAVGEKVRDFFLERNRCSRHTKPDLAMITSKVAAARAAHRTEFECTDYQDCQEAPVRWCVHSEGGYEDLNHGWPTLGGKVIWDFVSRLWAP